MAKKKSRKQQLKIIKAARGEERKAVLASGGQWTRPTVKIELKNKYNRKRDKQEMRRNEEY